MLNLAGETDQAESLVADVSLSPDNGSSKKRKSLMSSPSVKHMFRMALMTFPPASFSPRMMRQK